MGKSNGNQKRYNRDIYNSGKKSIQYINETLANMNKYSNNYMDRLQEWQDKLNNEQLDLLSSSYLKQNAEMLRNQAAFGSNSTFDQTQMENAYQQQNYLANVNNANVAAANALQNNELAALGNNYQYQSSNREAGWQAAQNLDALATTWSDVLGSGLQAGGAVLSAIPTPYTQVAGAAMSAAGGMFSGMHNKNTGLFSGGLSDKTQMQFQNIGTVLNSKDKETGETPLSVFKNDWNNYQQKRQINRTANKFGSYTGNIFSNSLPNRNNIGDFYQSNNNTRNV